MSLRERLIARIVRDGPISVADYMDACLHDPEGGYYARRPRLGEAGDFITAPHVSQMFGELLGLWAASVWDGLGRPVRVRLIELGPGDGTLMADILRAIRALPTFLAAIDVWLVETSGPLRQHQKTALSSAVVPIHWTDHLEAIPDDQPVIILANEFLDCFPIRQATWTGSGWRERRIGMDTAGKLAFVTCALPIQRADTGEEGDHLEWSDALADFGRRVGALIARVSGAALFIDYGRDRSGRGDTLQALRGHATEAVLENPGHADLTAHVDFPAFLVAGLAGGAMAAPILTQETFLRGLGIEARAETLAFANPGHTAKIGRQRDRLIGPDGMGELFKAACLYSPGLRPRCLAPHEPAAGS